MSNLTLKGVSVVILDEVHERSAATGHGHGPYEEGAFMCCCAVHL
jgi:hypothetical protein